MKQLRLKSRKLSRLPRKLLPMEPQSPKEVSNSPQPDVPDPRTWLQQPDQPPPRPPSPRDTRVHDVGAATAAAAGTGRMAICR